MQLEEVFSTPIAFHRSLVDLTGSITAALMLGQAWYWTARTPDPEGWFYKSADEWQQEIAMSRREQEGARDKLRKLGFWKEERRGIPCQLYFRIDKDEFRKALRVPQLGNLIPQKGKTGRDKKGRLVSPKRENYKESKTTQETTASTSNWHLPDWIPSPAWEGFEIMRRKIRKPLTDRARELTVLALQKLQAQGEDPVACLDQSTQRDWQGVFAVHRNGNGGNGHGRKLGADWGDE